MTVPGTRAAFAGAAASSAALAVHAADNGFSLSLVMNHTADDQYYDHQQDNENYDRS